MLNRSQPYMKNYRRMNLWYDYNNIKHWEVGKATMSWPVHFVKRVCKHDFHFRAFNMFFGLPFFLFLLNQRKKFKPKKEEKKENYYGYAQYVANIGRNHYGFETRVTKSFEHTLSAVVGDEVLNHILNMDGVQSRTEANQDESAGLAGDFAEEDIVDIYREEKHDPHLGIVYRHPHKHYLNDSPNDLLSPYKVLDKKE